MKKIVSTVLLAVLIILMINMVSAYHHYGYYPKYKTDSFRETTEFRKVTDSYSGDYWDSQRVRKTVTERTDVTRTKRYPSYHYGYGYGYGGYHKPYYDYGYGYKPISKYSYYKPYHSRNLVYSNYADYYYDRGY